MKAFFAVLLLAFSCTFLHAQSDAAPFDALAGNWSYSVDTPDGVYTGTMLLPKAMKVMSVSW